MPASSPAFAWGLHGIIDYPPGSAIGLRRMGDFELVWIIEGEVSWISGGRTIHVPPGHLTLAKPGDEDGWRWDTRRMTRHAFVHFTVLDPGDLPPSARWPAMCPLPELDAIRPLFRQILRLLADRPEGWERLADSALAHLLRSLASGQIDAGWEPGRGLPVPVRDCLDLAARRWAGGTCTAIGLPDLARAGGVSKEHLCRLFRQACGCGALEALREARLGRAATLLARTDLGVGEVGTRCGFPDPYHFSRRFSARFGAAPRRWRELARSGATVLAADPRLAAVVARLWPG
jgi:AraC-like DNA-binding protein